MIGPWMVIMWSQPLETISSVASKGSGWTTKQKVATDYTAVEQYQEYIQYQVGIFPTVGTFLNWIQSRRHIVATLRTPSTASAPFQC